MKFRAVVFTLSAVPLVAFAMFVSGCGGSDSNNQVTNPPTTTEPFDSGTLPNGGSFAHVFPNDGTFGYRCRIHSGMVGTVTVAPGGADSALVPIGNNVFGVPTVGSFPIHAGGTVRWINNGVPHTVSRP